MQFIGRWISYLTDCEYPPPHELVGELDPQIRASIVEYLRSGHQLHLFRGYSTCLFSCGHEEVHAMCTDGTWVWPLDYAHYVEVHGVLVPPDFCNSVLNSSILQEFDVNWQSQEHDLTFWREWCEQNADRSFRSRLSTALVDAKRRLSELVLQKTDELERECGLSSATCHWSGCTQQALLGKALCARCILKGNESAFGSHLLDVRTALND